MSTSFDTIIVANRRYEELFNAGKLDELVNLYTSEGKLLLSNKNKYEGREKIFKILPGKRDAGVDNLDLTTETVIEAEDDRLI
ncbi:unnamed protein product [Rotaria sp. Silwood2]|nr:unnamed protein product [Rotaria sp. Silwood2]CAF4224503.1 unnamed protein product [Rotaria sp. Silwood2]